MNRLILLIGFILIITSVVGQNAFRKVSSSFENSEDYFCSELSKKTIQLYTKKLGANNEKVEILKGIEDIRVLSFATQNTHETSKFIQEIKACYPLHTYSPFKVNSGGINNQFIYLKESGDHFTDLLVINTNRVKISMVEIQGDIDLDRIAQLESVLNLEGIDALDMLKVGKKEKKSGKKEEVKTYDVDNKFVLAQKSGKVTVYNRYGTELLNTDAEPDLLVNGYKPSVDFHSFLYEVDPACIQSINVTKQEKELSTGGHIDILLRGNIDDAYTVCNGMLYFGQNGFLQCIKIDDDCSPELLYNCREKPLSSILQMNPDQVKSILLTTDPLNCEDPLKGEFVVVELK